MTRTDHRALITTIDKLYAAALEPSERHDFLSSIASLFGATNAFVCRLEQQRKVIEYYGLPQPQRARVPVKQYSALIEEDPRTPVFRASHGRAVHCRMGPSAERLRGSRAYRDYLAPLDIEYTMVVQLWMEDGGTQDLGLTRGRSGKAFDETDCALLNEIVPHLRRGFTIGRTLADRTPRPGPLLVPPPPRDDDQQTLQRHFALSPAQARLTLALLDGCTLKAAAADQGIKESSARQYLNLIFDKTGARRQIDLIRLVGRTLDRD